MNLTRMLKIILCTITVTLFLSGCWDSVDIEDKTIDTIISYDKNDHGYVFYGQIISFASNQQNKGGGGPSQGLQSLVVKSEGKTFTEAREKLDAQVSRQMFLGAAQVAIIGERAAKDGIEEYLKRVRSGFDYRKTLDVVITNENIEDILNYKDILEPSSGFAISSTIRAAVSNGKSYRFMMADMLEKMSSPNDCYLLHMITLNSGITLDGYAVMNHGKMKGTTPPDEGDGIIILKVKKPALDMIVPTSHGDVTVRVRKLKEKITPLLSEGKIEFNIHLEFNAQVLYTSQKVAFTQQISQEVNSNLDGQIKALIEKTINTSQRFESDYLDFYDSLRIKYPQEVKKMDWEKEFPQADFQVSVSSVLAVTNTVDYYIE
ncbi:MAG: Ger(x)C family spore germination protein [Smithella sp.]|nr:Ger(x)C family spore germination protein [Chloroflexota bacterium]